MCLNCTIHISTAQDLHPGMSWVWSCYERLLQCCNVTELLCFEEQSHHSLFIKLPSLFLPWQLFQHTTDLLYYLCYKEFQTAMRFTVKCTRKHQYCRHLLVEKWLLGQLCISAGIPPGGRRLRKQLSMCSWKWISLPIWHLINNITKAYIYISYIYILKIN